MPHSLIPAAKTGIAARQAEPARAIDATLKSGYPQFVPDSSDEIAFTGADAGRC